MIQRCFRNLICSKPPFPVIPECRWSVSYYTNKNISVSYLRAKKKNDLDRIMGLYGSMNERYW